MNTPNLKGKLYLIPTTLGESNAEEVLPQLVKKVIDFGSGNFDSWSLKRWHINF